MSQPIFRLIETRVTSITNNLSIGPLSLDLYPDQWLVIVGHNGTGKSLLLETIYGNRAISSGRRENHCDTMSCVFEYKAVNSSLPITVTELFATCAKVEPQLWTLCHQKFALQQILDTPIELLSKNMFQAVMLTYAVISAPDILLLSEYSNGIDAKSCAVMESVINSLQKNYQTSIVETSHDCVFMPKNSDRIIAFNGKILFDDSSDRAGSHLHGDLCQINQDILHNSD